MMKLLVFILILTASTAFASEGGMGSGGGFVVVCPKTPVSEREVELLDLYEVKQQGIKLIQSTGNLNEDYFNSVDTNYTLQGYPHIAEERREAILKNLKKTMQSVKFLNDPEDLPVANDIGVAPWIPSQCSLKQIAFLDDAKTVIYILKGLWDELDTQNQVALLRHELFGRFGRKLNEGTTQQARSFVGHSFAKIDSVKKINEGLTYEAKRYSASSKINNELYLSSFHILRYKSSKVSRLQFSQLFGHGMLTKTWIDIPFDFDIETTLDYENFGIHDQLRCLVKTENIDETFRVPVKGTMSATAEIEISFKTGDYIKMDLYRNKKFISSSFFTQCP